MAYDLKLAQRVRQYLATIPAIEVEEKKMFSGLAFLVNGKMCVNVSGENLMCRFDPVLIDELSEKNGYLPMIMKGKALKGYCYVEPTAIKNKQELGFWIRHCLDFNNNATSSKKKRKT